MKKQFLNNTGKGFVATMLLTLHQLQLMAQDSSNVTINTGEVKGWFVQNWMWVAIGALALILIIAMASGGSKKAAVKKTTIVREEDSTGMVRTTTTEITE